jgi:H/ACA ribonucleoprotein complex subunit 3
MKSILKCGDCGSYSLNEKCSCGGKCVTCVPPKYTPEDKYGDYRREVKQEFFVERGWL